MIVVTGCRAALAAKGIDLSPLKAGEAKVQTALTQFLPGLTSWSYRFAEDDLTIFSVTSLTATQQTKMATWGLSVTVGSDPS